MDYYSSTNLTNLMEQLDRCTDEKEREMLENDIEQIQDFLFDWSRETGEHEP